MQLSSKILTLLLIANLGNSFTAKAADIPYTCSEKLSEIAVTGAVVLFGAGLMQLFEDYQKDSEIKELRKNINDLLQFGYQLPYYQNHEELIKSFKFKYDQTIRYLEKSHLDYAKTKALRSLIHKIYKAKKMILNDYTIKSTHITRSEKNALVDKINIYLFRSEQYLKSYIGAHPSIRYVPSDLEKAVDTLVWDLRLKAQMYDDHEKIVINAFGGLYQEIINTIYQYVSEQKYDKAQERFNAFCSKLHIPHRSLGLALH